MNKPNKNPFANKPFFLVPGKKSSQADLVLWLLNYKGPVTTDQLERIGVKSPSAVIHKLRKSGYRIRTKLIWKLTHKYSFMMKQAEYRLVSTSNSKITLKVNRSKGEE